MSKLTLDTEISALFDGLDELISNARQKVAIYLNAESTLLYWSVGHYINTKLQHHSNEQYGKQILATLSQLLTQRHGKGFSYSAITRMIKVANVFDKENIATLSQQLSWSHLIELAAIEEPTKRLFYQHQAVAQKWGVRRLRDQYDAMLFERTAIAQKDEASITKVLQNEELHPDEVFKNTYILDFLDLQGAYSEKDLESAIILQLEKFILELGQGFAFIERQKRMTIDTTNYFLDLLFYHRKLNRLIAIDLKLGKFKPEHKAQMELYLKYLQKHEQQSHENTPIGLLLCSEGNTEHIELLMLGEENIKVAQYLTELPNKQWFLDKLHKAKAIAEQNINDQ